MQLGGRSFHSSSGIVRYMFRIFDTFTWVRIMTYFSSRTCTKTTAKTVFLSTKIWIEQSFEELKVKIIRGGKLKALGAGGFDGVIPRDFQVIHRSKARWNVEDAPLGDIG